MSSGNSRPWKPQSLKMGAVIQGEGAVTNLDFHKDGRFLAMSTNENSIHLIDSLNGSEKKKIFVKSHGVGKIKFTHHNQTILVSSERRSHDIRSLCLFDNRYVRNYKGHSARVTSLSMSPTDDYFLSTGVDKSVCMWNLASPSPIAKLQLPTSTERPFASYDAGGLIFGVLCYDSKLKYHTLKLYDARSYEQGPFQDIAPKSHLIESALSKLPNASIFSRGLQTPQWSDFAFSNDGLRILVNTQSEYLYVIDSFNADAEPLIISRKNELGSSLGACFSSDGLYVATGNDDNEIQVFDTKKGELQSTLMGHVAPVGSIQCNPRYDVMAAGCVNTALWIQP